MNKKQLVKLSCDMKVKEIIETLKNDTDTELYNKYVKRFENEESEVFIEDLLLNEVINSYCQYYRDVFYKEIENEDSIRQLSTRLCKILDTDETDDINEVEKKVKEVFNSKGYEFRGGSTSGYYGPYIWKSTEKKVYEVEIPEDVMKLPIYFLHGFVHNSWLEYLSFNYVATGGWSTSDGIYCVFERYEKDIDTPKFNISFLKHESQHNKDYMNNDWNFSVPVLEYRAKLCEIAYYPNTDKIQEFINTASKDSKHGHSEAEFWVVSDLSKVIFNVEFEKDVLKWVKNLDRVREEAKRLILTYNRGEVNLDK